MSKFLHTDWSLAMAYKSTDNTMTSDVMQRKKNFAVCCCTKNFFALFSLSQFRSYLFNFFSLSRFRSYFYLKCYCKNLGSQTIHLSFEHFMMSFCGLQEYRSQKADIELLSKSSSNSKIMGQISDKKHKQL